MLTLYLEDTLNGLMSVDRNPTRHLPLATAHLVTQILAWMWGTILSLAVGSYLAFGITAIAHSLLLFGIFVTFVVFREARRSEPGR